MKEIGGYFGLEQLLHEEYYKLLISLNSGRNALLYLLAARNIKKIFLPYYLCSSVSEMCTAHGYKFEFYHTGEDFKPLFDGALGSNEYLYIVNYYGQISNKEAIQFKAKYGNIIFDNAHAFFQEPVIGIDTIYSCRKFFGVPDGAYLSTEAQLREELRTDVSQGRMTHILGRYEGSASEYYSYFQMNELSFKTEPLKRMSMLTHNILGAIDYEFIRRKRDENYSFLSNELGNTNKLKLTKTCAAYTYPFYAENGNEIRKVLSQKKIYIPTLWPNVLLDTPQGSIEHTYTTNILPLPCDQRYDIEDMEHLVEELRKCMN